MRSAPYLAAMTDAPATLRTAREETIDALCDQFARDALSLPELERRLTKAREARTRDDLRTLLADLARPPAPVPAKPGARDRLRAEPADATRTAPVRTAGSDDGPTGSNFALAVMGGTRRAGKWRPPSNMLAMAIMGGVELDFREAILRPGVTEINVFTFWGGIEITVPPGVHVESNCMALMAGYEEDARLESDPAPGAPTIRINGVAIMAGIEVRVLLPGESRPESSHHQKRVRGGSDDA